jgi:hypothetical protein
MTTKEQWKLGILIAGMLIIAVAVASHRIERAIAQPQPPPAYRQPPTPVAAPVVATPVEPKYPIHKLIAVTQNDWSEEVSVNDGEQLEWHLLDENAWLDTRANRTEEFRQFPLNDSRWKPLSTPSDTRILAFRITPGTLVRSANVAVGIRKAVVGGFFARERRLPSVTPSLTDAGVKAGARWPSEIEPTRFGKFPPDDLSSGNVAFDTVYPIEDVMYRIAPGWDITPFTDDGKVSYEAAKAPGGFRLRVLNPDTSIIVKFRMVQAQNRDTSMSGQRPTVNQGIFNRNSSQTTPPVTQPVVRPYVPPRQPSYYPTSPTGPSYYPK